MEQSQIRIPKVMKPTASKITEMETPRNVVKQTDSTVYIKETITARAISSEEIASLLTKNCLSAGALYRFLGNNCVNQLKKFRKSSEKLSGVSERSCTIYSKDKKYIDSETAKINESLSYIPYSLRSLGFKVDAPIVSGNIMYVKLLVEDSKILDLMGITVDLNDITRGIIELNQDNLLLKNSLLTFIVSQENSKYALPLIKRTLSSLKSEEEALLIVRDNDRLKCYLLYEGKLSPLDKNELLKLSKLSSNKQASGRIVESYERYIINLKKMNSKLNK